MRKIGVLVLLAVLGPTGACRDGGGDCEAEENEDLAGTWQLDLVVTSECAPVYEVGDTDTMEIAATQDDAQITIDLTLMNFEAELTGSICGDSFSARGTDADTLGECSYTASARVRGTVDGDTAEGTIDFTLDVNDPEVCFGITSCDGGFSFTADRM